MDSKVWYHLVLIALWFCFMRIHITMYCKYDNTVPKLRKNIFLHVWYAWHVDNFFMIITVKLDMIFICPTKLLHKKICSIFSFNHIKMSNKWSFFLYSLHVCKYSLTIARFASQQINVIEIYEMFTITWYLMQLNGSVKQQIFFCWWNQFMVCL